MSDVTAEAGSSVGARVLRTRLGPALLMLVTPPITLVLWLVNERYQGSFGAFWAHGGLAHWASEVPRPSWWAALLFISWSLVQWGLLRWLPGETHFGPPTPAGLRPEYKKNGVAAWVVTHALLAGGFASGILSGAAFVAHYGELLATLTTVAFAFCAWIYVRAIWRAPRPDDVRTGNRLFDFFQGVETHPRAWSVSLKQLVNCRISMMGWSAIVVTLAVAQAETPSGLSAGLAVSAGLVIVYLFKFFWWETGYFASLDIMHDRFGYYICWGVLAWVPAVYPIAQLYLARHPTHISWPAGALLGALGLLALTVNYAADAQRQRVRATNGETRVWARAPAIIVAPYRTSDGRMRENLLLASGYWGIARHFHYLPELVLAFAWTAPAGFAVALPYFYFAFLSVLLVDRATRDDRRCAHKYGSAWDEYCARVPFKIVPGVY